MTVVPDDSGVEDEGTFFEAISFPVYQVLTYSIRGTTVNDARSRGVGGVEMSGKVVKYLSWEV